MAIVPDLSGVRPGRPGNIPLFDPRNRSNDERKANQDDCYKTQTNLTTAVGNQLAIAANPTRNALMFMIPESAETVYISMASMSAPAGIPVVGSVGLEFKGKAAEQAYYAWSASGSVVLSILEG